MVAGCFETQLSQEMPFGTLEEMPPSFSSLNQRPHTGNFSPSQPPRPARLGSECQNQTKSEPPAPWVTMLGCSLLPLLARGWQGKKRCAGAPGGSQPAARTLCRAPHPLAAPARHGLCPHHPTCSSSQARTTSPGSWTSQASRDG